MAGNQRICFREKDEIGPQLLKLAKNDSQLWCEGLNPHSLKPHKEHKKKKRSALDEKAERVHSLADKL